MKLEIEKKFLLTAIPQDLVFDSVKEIHQSYLAVGKEEVRIRKSIVNNEEKHSLTIKKGKGLVREELDMEISLETYNQLLENSTKKPLIKTRKTTKVKWNESEYILEIDIYENLNNLKIVEVEFVSEESAKSFEHPSWFGEDVTENKYYKNQNLWLTVQ